MESTLVTALETLDIKWQPINIVINARTQKKEPNPVDGATWLAKSTDFTDGGELSLSELSRRQSMVCRGTHLCIDTRKIAQIDVDCPDMMGHQLIKRLMETTPYFLSCTKKLPHFFVAIKGTRPNVTTLPLKMFGKKTDGQWRVEVLCGKWSWAVKDEIVYNSGKDVVEITEDEFNEWTCRTLDKRKRPYKDSTGGGGSSERPSKTLQTEASAKTSENTTMRTFTEDVKKNVERYVRGFSKERATGWDTWSKVIFGILNIAHTHTIFMTPDVPNPILIAWAKAQAHVFSRKADNYSESGVEDLISRFVVRGDAEPRIGVSALSKWYHEDRESREESEDESETKVREAKNGPSALEAAMMFIKRRHSTLALCNGQVIWVHDGRWTPLTVQMLRDYMTYTDKRASIYGQWVTRPQPLLDILPSAASSQEGSKLVTQGGKYFKEDVGDRGVGKLSWKNGTYDFVTKLFMPTTPENAGLSAVKRNFPAPERNVEAEEELMNFMKLVFPDEADLKAILYCFARAIAGHVADQRIIFLVGATSNGKTSMRNLFVRAFPGIVDIFNAAHLSSTRTDDADRANTWLLPLEGIRLCFSDELTTKHLNGGRIKSITMGEVETLGVRRLYHENSTTVVTSTFVLLLNKKPICIPADKAIDKRSHVWDMLSTFVDDGDPRIGDENVHVASKDISKQLRRDTRLHDALFWILTDAYNGDVPDFSTIKGVIDSSVAISETTQGDPLLGIFEFTEDVNDFMFNSHIVKHVHDNINKTSDMRTLSIALVIHGAKKASGQKKNPETGKMERFHTNIKRKA